MLGIQRSIPIPRIGIDKLINYIITVGENPGINCSTLRSKGLDIGKGRGDITRFFARIGIVRVGEDCSVALTEVGQGIYRALIRDVYLGKSLLHLVLYSELPHYRLLMDLVAMEGEVGVDDLFKKVNERVRELSPSAWINEVAFKALLGLGKDLGVINVSNGRVSLRHAAAVSECLRSASVELDGQEIVRLGDLESCLRGVVGAFDSGRFMDMVRDCVEPIVAPGTNPRASYLKILNRECVLRALLSTLLSNI